MRILYFSLHQILEFDEISIFRSLGHEVFTLGSYFGGTASQPFRPIPEFDASLPELMSKFHEIGGHYQYGIPASEQRIPREFVELFDIVVVMHDLDFIETHWNALSTRKVVWRSIGVGTQEFEPRVAALRAKGMKVVRYCPTENRADGYAGHDAIIRFGKVGSACSWVGGRNEILTFSHVYQQRFPVEFAFYLEATRGFETLVGGDGNAGLPGSVGVVDFETQNQLFKQCAVYFYASGSAIPYTLNFMEAWLSGIPLVAINCRAIHSDDHCRFAEVPELIQHGKNGFLVNEPAEAASIFRALLDEPQLAQSISAEGAKAASSYFSSEVIAPKWQTFLTKIA